MRKYFFLVVTLFPVKLVKRVNALETGVEVVKPVKNTRRCLRADPLFTMVYCELFNKCVPGSGTICAWGQEDFVKFDDTCTMYWFNCEGRGQFVKVSMAHCWEFSHFITRNFTGYYDGPNMVIPKNNKTRI